MFLEFSDVFMFKLTESGFFSALPYLALSISVIFSSFLADWLQVKNILTTTQVRRYFNCLSFTIQAVFLFFCAKLVSPFYTILLLTIGVAVGGFSLSGFAVNHLDIAPKYASILFGISNCFASIPGIVSPILTGYIVTTPVKEDLFNFAKLNLIFFRTEMSGLLCFTSPLEFMFLEAYFTGFLLREKFKLGQLRRFKKKSEIVKI